MPRKCTVCSSPDRDAVDTALLRGASFRDVANRFGVSHAAAFRHNGHMKRAAVRAVAESPEAYGRTILARMDELTIRAMRLLERLEKKEDARGAVAAVREVRGCLESLARLHGDVDHRQAREEHRPPRELPKLPAETQAKIAALVHAAILGRTPVVLEAELVEAAPS